MSATLRKKESTAKNPELPLQPKALQLPHLLYRELRHR